MLRPTPTRLAFEQQLPSEMMEQSPIDISVMESHRVQPNANHDECAESVLGHVDAELTYHGSNFQINWKSKEHNYLKINGKVFHTVMSPSLLGSNDILADDNFFLWEFNARMTLARKDLLDYITPKPENAMIPNSDVESQ
ncbi:TPA: hypothetical protein N0F65_007324 [Lagenidium giganteum]|uniref:Uncharacterized protein n=1 Tax=Lagenidium giganteum TaxID=4803 RepID=A0AAV2Z6X4_9STRA|nr:TPA: hypothetical protein N0F65_007324 [Lagenidium giganteum]